MTLLGFGWLRSLRRAPQAPQSYGLLMVPPGAAQPPVTRTQDHPYAGTELSDEAFGPRGAAPSLPREGIQSAAHFELIRKHM